MVKINRYGNFLRVYVNTVRYFNPYKIKIEVIDGEHIKKILTRKSGSEKWVIYAYQFNIYDIKVRREKTMRKLRGIGVSESDLRQINIIK